MERATFASIQQMIASLQLDVEPITRKSGAILKTPVPRPEWMICNDDVDLQLKIGSVSSTCSLAFGKDRKDVMRLQKKFAKMVVLLGEQFIYEKLVHFEL